MAPRTAQLGSPLEPPALEPTTPNTPRVPKTPRAAPTEAWHTTRGLRPHAAPPLANETGPDNTTGDVATAPCEAGP
eukprot:9699619-Lingulodinium_polyedra.AAC.1